MAVEDVGRHHRGKREEGNDPVSKYLVEPACGE